MNKTEDLNPILTALKAEKRAIAYYARAAARITNPTGKEALKKLKAEEEKHYKNLKAKFKKIFGRDPVPGEEEKELAKEEVNHIATLKKVCQILSA